MKTFLDSPFDLELHPRLEILVANYFLYFLLQKFDFSVRADIYLFMFTIHSNGSIGTSTEYQTFPLQAYSIRDKNNFIFSLFLPN